jgi:hypothetical protein
MAIGHVKHGPDGKILDREIGLVCDGYQRKPREELAALHVAHWQVGCLRPRVFWFASFLVDRPASLVIVVELVVYGPFASSQLKAIKDLIAVVRRSERQGKEPVVLIGSRSFKNQSGGTTHVPLFTIVGWQFWYGQPTPEVPLIAVPIAPAAPAKALPPRKSGDDNDLNDRIPSGDARPGDDTPASQHSMWRSTCTTTAIVTIASGAVSNSLSSATRAAIPFRPRSMIAVIH